MLIRTSGARDWRKFFFTLDITVNGKPVRDVFEADDESGYVLHYPRGDDGKLVEVGDRYAVARVEGTVVFVGQRRFNPDDAKARAQEKRDRRQIRNIGIERRNARLKGGAA